MSDPNPSSGFSSSQGEPTLPDTGGPARSDDWIGPYRLLEMLGEGGMGVVFLAEQERPVRRRVALKLIKLGMDTKEVVARFELERQALAVMNHPCIAKVYDAGATEQGRPYFVMEYAAGVPLTDYCDTQRLSTRERLELFMEVCHAVQHAHQKGIIHRDLKPSNVLITMQDGKPLPKIIDFGIAKATDHRLTDKTLYTQQGQLIGTPVYMSPEQLDYSGLDIDTRADVYSLGVILYELLVGTLPFDRTALRHSGIDEFRRNVRDSEPLRPSTRLTHLEQEAKAAEAGAARQAAAATPTAYREWRQEDNVPIPSPEQVAQRRRTDRKSLAKQLRGDLDWITLKAMDRDRMRRYASASELAADIARHLNNEPVLAGPPSMRYRLQKFLRKHRGAVVAGVALFAALAAGLVVSTYLYIDARRARDAARRSAAQAEAINAYLRDMLASADPGKEGRDVKVADVLQKATEKIGTAFANEPSVEAAVRDTLGMTYKALGLYDAADPQLHAALDIRRRVLGGEHPDTLASMSNLVELLYSQGKMAEVGLLARDVVVLREKVLGKEHPDTLASMNDLSLVFYDEGRQTDAENLLRETWETRKRVLGPEHNKTLLTQTNYARMLQWDGKLTEAEQLLRPIVDIRRRALGPEHPETLTTIDFLANVLQDEEKLAEAEALQEQLLEARRRVLGPEHPETLTTMNNLATILEDRHKYAEAERWLQQVLETQLRVLGAKHMWVTTARRNLANVWRQMGRCDEAEALLREALAVTREKFGPEQLQTAQVLDALARLAEMRNDPAAAEPLYREVLAIRRKVHGAEHLQTAVALNNLGQLLRDTGQYAESEALLRETLEIYRKLLGTENNDTTRVLQNLASVLADKGDLAQAEALLREALAMRRKLLGGDHWKTAQCERELADVLLRKKDAAAAEPLLREALRIFEKTFGGQDWDTLDAQSRLGECLTALGRYEAAEALLLPSYEQIKNKPECWPRNRLRTLRRLARLYEVWGKPEKAAEYRALLPASQPVSRPSKE